MSNNWRDLVTSKDWKRIKYWELSGSDRSELLDILCNLVPRVVRGSGLDIFEDYIDPSDLPLGEAHDAAWLLEGIRGFPNSAPPTYHSDWLRLARGRASSVADEYGIRLLEQDGTPRNTSEIFIYFDKDGAPVELREDIARAILRRRIEIESGYRSSPSQNCPAETDDFEKLKTWARKYHWRSVLPLRRIAQARWFGENSQVDRALMLFHLCELWEAEGCQGDSGIAFEAGVHFEALVWKLTEPAALRYYKNLAQNRKSGKLGGQGAKKRERYEVLNRLAAENLSRFQFVSDAQALRTARNLASDYDRGASTPLFQINNKPLSREWYSDWLIAFRAALSAST